MNAESMLQSKDTYLITEERPSKDIVVGVPHHAPAGTPNLPCPEHIDSDENAGFLGRYLAETLGCCSIIACNSTIDVNKSSRSAYAVQIAQWNPKVLIEIFRVGSDAAKNGNLIKSERTKTTRYTTTP